MSSTGRKVLVVIITKDIVEPACMESILKQDYPDYDVLIHVAKAKKYFTNADDPRNEAFVNQYINCPENRNKARRLALASDADFFMLVDSDTVLPTYAISRLMMRNKDAVGGYYFACGNSKNYVAGGYEKNSKGQDIFLHCIPPIIPGMLKVSMIGLGCVLLSRKILEAIEFEAALDIYNLVPDFTKPPSYDPPQTLTLADGRQMELRPYLEEPRMIAMGECAAFGFRAAQKGFELFMDGTVEVIEHLTRDGHYTTIAAKDNNQQTEAI